MFIPNACASAYKTYLAGHEAKICRAVARYVPLVGSLPYATSLFIKTWGKKCISEDAISDSHVLTYLNGISFEEARWGLVPIIGNIYIYIYRNYFDEKSLLQEPACLRLPHFNDWRSNKETMKRLVKNNPVLLLHVSYSLCESLILEDNQLINQIPMNTNKLLFEYRMNELIFRNPNLINYLTKKKFNDLVKDLLQIIHEINCYADHSSNHTMTGDDLINYLNDDKIIALISKKPNLFKKLKLCWPEDRSLLIKLASIPSLSKHCDSSFYQHLHSLIKENISVIDDLPKDLIKEYLKSGVSDLDTLFKIVEIAPIAVSYVDEITLANFISIKPCLINHVNLKVVKDYIDKTPQLIRHINHVKWIAELINKEPSLWHQLSPQQKEDKNLIRVLICAKCSFPTEDYKEDPHFISIFMLSPSMEDAFAFLFSEELKQGNLSPMVEHILLNHNFCNKVMNYLIKEQLIHPDLLQKLKTSFSTSLYSKAPINCAQWGPCMESILENQEVRNQLFDNFETDLPSALYLLWWNPTLLKQIVKMDQRFFKYVLKGYELAEKFEQSKLFDPNYPYIPSVKKVQHLFREISLENDDFHTFFTKEQLSDRKLVKKLVKMNHRIFPHISDRLKKDEKLIKSLSVWSVAKFLNPSQEKWLQEEHKELRETMIYVPNLLKDSCEGFLKTLDASWVKKHLKNKSATLEMFKYLPNELRNRANTLLEEVFYNIDHEKDLETFVRFTKMCLEWQKKDENDIEISQDLISLILEKYQEIYDFNKMGQVEFEKWMESDKIFLRLMDNETIRNQFLTCDCSKQSILKSHLWKNVPLFEQLIKKDDRFLKFSCEVLLDHAVRYRIVSSSFITDLLREKPELVRKLDDRWMNNQEEDWKENNGKWKESYFQPTITMCKTYTQVASYLPKNLQKDIYYLKRLVKEYGRMDVLKYCHSEVRNDPKIFEEMCKVFGYKVYFYAGEKLLEKLEKEKWSLIKAQYNRKRPPKNVSPEFFAIFGSKYPEVLLWNGQDKNMMMLFLFIKYCKGSPVGKLPPKICRKIFAQQWLSGSAATDWVNSNKLTKQTAPNSK